MTLPKEVELPWNFPHMIISGYGKVRLNIALTLSESISLTEALFPSHGQNCCCLCPMRHAGHALHERMTTPVTETTGRIS